jgi:long-chain acyl-CoA synthetase
MGLYDYTVYNVIQRNARIQKDRVAWISGDEKISHLEFLKRVDSLAFGLAEAGLKHGDRIGVLSQNCMEYVYLYGAAAKIGAIMAPINWRLKPQEIEFIFSDAKPGIVFVGTGFQKLVEELLPRFDFIEDRYAMGTVEGDFKAFGDLMRNEGGPSDSSVKTDDPYVSLYTAAVTGMPRGAVLSHGNFIMANLQTMYMWRITSEDCHLCMLPLFHVAGVGSCLSVVQAGGRNVLMTRFDADQALKQIQDEKVSFFVEFPPMLANLLDRNEELKLDISSLRLLGGLDSPEVVKRYEELTGGTYWTAYGQSETTGFVTLAPYFEKPGSAGLPACMTRVEIMNHQGDLVEPGVEGEIVARGPLVFNGYWNLDRENDYTFRDGWHHTGDRGRFDEDGYLWYTGRMPEKELIKPGGENVYPGEVEKAILTHPSIEEVSVIGVPDEEWGEAVKAVCVLRRGEALEPEDLIEYVGGKIARYKKPKHVVFVPELRKGDDGAVDRAKVKGACGQD